MSIDDKINEALGISTSKPSTKQVVKKEFTNPNKCFISFANELNENHEYNSEMFAFRRRRIATSKQVALFQTIDNKGCQRSITHTHGLCVAIV